MLQISDSHMEEWQSFWLIDTNEKETLMGKRQKWKRVHVCPITVHVSSSWLCNKWKDGTRASWAQVLFKQYSSPWCSSTKPIFNSPFPRQRATVDLKKWYSSSPSSSTIKSGRLLYCSETVFLGKIFPKLMVMGHFAHSFSYWSRE